MLYIPFGVECKNQDCRTGIILGDMLVADQPLRGGAAIDIVVLRPTHLKCPGCQTVREYTQDDLRQFPNAPPRNQ
jgi:hypothetical protein